MFCLTRNKLLVVVSVVLLTGFSVGSRPRKALRVPTGSWGGVHIQMDVTQNSATINYDCASGTIDVPLTTDSRGRFSWRGTHKHEAGGPIRLGRLPKSLPAIFSGSVKGDTMTLTVKLSGTTDVIDTYTLRRGSAGRVFKCR